MNFIQFSFLLQQTISAGLLSWRIYVLKDFYRNYAQWYYRVLGTVLYLGSMNGLWLCTLSCVHLDLPLSCAYLNIMAAMTVLLINAAMRCLERENLRLPAKSLAQHYVVCYCGVLS